MILQAALLSLEQPSEQKEFSVGVAGVLPVNKGMYSLKS
jgi:hypothetical protein